MNLEFQSWTLDSFAVYRARALAHVVSALNQLRQLQADLRGLRNRVVEGKVTVEHAGADITTLRDQIRNIQRGLDDLSAYRRSYIEK